VEEDLMDNNVFKVETTVDSLDVGEMIARITLSEKLCGCVQIIPDVTSYYHWNGKLTRSNEILVVFKTTTSRVSELMARIKEIHPYEIPEILAQEINLIDKGYHGWLDDVMKETPQ